MAVLPDSIPHATGIAAGRSADLTWGLTRRLEGERLDLAWPRLSFDSRHEAVVAIGRVLKALHDWAPPQETRQRFLDAEADVLATRESIVGASILPLPVTRLASLLEWIGEPPGMDSDLLARVQRRVNELTPVFADGELRDGVLVHCDAHFANVLWREGRMVALLDFEWARLGPADLEFEAACREDPQIAAGSALGPVLASESLMLTWLREGYPRLFEGENLTERLWLYELAHQIRQFCVDRDVEADATQVRRLEILAAGPRVQF
jgi:aminoglycoside phosphotransferase (APT) family kinase protein